MSESILLTALVAGVVAGVFGLVNIYLIQRHEKRVHTNRLRLQQLARAADNNRQEYDYLLSLTNMVLRHVSSFGTIDGAADDRSDAFLLQLYEIVVLVGAEYSRSLDDAFNPGIRRVSSEVHDRCRGVDDAIRKWCSLREPRRGLRVQARMADAPDRWELISTGSLAEALSRVRLLGAYAELAVANVPVIPAPNRASEMAYTELIADVAALREQLKRINSM